MVAFSKAEIDPELLPAIQLRIRKAQEDALAHVGEGLPRSTALGEQAFDKANRDHQLLIRSSVSVPDITISDPLEKYWASSSRLLYLTMLGAGLLTLIVVSWFPGWRLNQWILGLALLALAFPVFVSALKFLVRLRAELPWIRFSATNARILREARMTTVIAVWLSIFTAIFMLTIALTHYSESPVRVIALTPFYIVCPILLLLLVTSIAMWLTVLILSIATERRLKRSEIRNCPLPLDAAEELRTRIWKYEVMSNRRDRDLTPGARRAIQTATEQVADELVSEHILTPELAQRLKAPTWWECRVLCTTPEFTPGATFPTSHNVQKSPKRYR